MSMDSINTFKGEYAFLSNFFECPIYYNGLMYNNVEAAFQAQKCPTRADEFCTLNGGEAKRLGRNVQIREDWEEVKEAVMKDLLVVKFNTNPDLQQKLLDTGKMLLIEGNRWHDNYWGACTCPTCRFKDKKNRLGTILMEVRDDIAGGRCAIN